MSQTMFPLIGDDFPNLSVHTTQGKLNLPVDMKGKWFMLFSHPGDFTPVCTTEFYAIAKNAEEFKKLNTELIGLSIDQVQAHIKWVEWIKDNLHQEITFPIIADDLGEAAQTLGMISPSKGKNTVRSVFIVDDKGKIRIILNYPQEVGRNVHELLRIIKALQVATERNVATPHNWPNNELIKDNVIIPPASTQKKAQENVSRYPQGYAWWFRFTA